MSKATPKSLILSMYDFYREGHTLRETAQRFSVSHQCVRLSFRREGLPIRSRAHSRCISSGIRQETMNMFAEYCAGKSSGEIGRKYYLTGGAVRRRFRVYGLVPGRAA